MTDTTNNNNVPHDQTTSTNGHLQDKLVKDSIAHNQSISAQAQARQSPLPNKASETVKKDSSHPFDTNDFTKVQDLPTGAPQGQQTTMPNNNTNNDSLNKPINNTVSSSANTQIPKQTLFNQRDDINNPHTPDTDGNEETYFGYKTVNKAEK